MFQKPEEVIMAILAAAWVVLTYFLAGWTGATAKYVLLISGLTAGWAVVAFWLWRAGWADELWPLLLGGLVACWWPWLDGFALRHIVAPAAGEVLVVGKPWYASWLFKIILALLPVVGGYVYKWRKGQKPKF